MNPACGESTATGCTVAVLAGGRSSRMGVDKSLLEIGGKPLLRHVIERVLPLELPVILVTNTLDIHAAFGLPMAADIRPDSGSIGGLYTALHSAGTEFVLAVACDMPRLNTALLQYLVKTAQNSRADAIVPRIDGYAHPLHAVYRCRVHAAVAAQIDTGNLRINRLFDAVAVQWMDERELRKYDPTLDSFVNLNTPDDVAALVSSG